MGIAPQTTARSSPPPRLAYPAFRPAFWLRNAHLQTLVAARRRRHWNYGWRARERIEIEIGAAGRLVAEASWQPGPRGCSPALILLHGLEGSARSHYLVGMSRKAFARGFHTVRVNLRNCGETEHLTTTLYCAALSEDIPRIVEHLRGACGVGEVHGAGVSLGANILLKFLGEREEAGRDFLSGLAVVSPPLDLALGARTLLKRSNWIYQKHFVRSLFERMRRKAEHFPGIVDLRRVARIKTVYEFDDVVTAPHFGYASADDYYCKASCGPLLSRIRVPTLMVQAKDDPLIPFESFRSAGIESNPFLELLATERGGHAAFLAARPASPDDLDEYWAEARVVQFLSALAFA
jgi:predicted alpha/beta-fold hydrolase